MVLLKLKAQEKERRREIILLAAQELFSRHGLSAVSIRDIASRAGVSVGFIYRYFPGRSDIFVELFEAGAGTIFEKMSADIRRQEPHPLRALARTYVDFLHENKAFFEMMSHFMLEGRLSEKALRRVNDALRRIMDGLESLFANEAGDRSRRILAHSFFAALNGVMISFAKYPGRSSQEIRNRTLLLAETIAEKFERPPPSRGVATSSDKGTEPSWTSTRGRPDALPGMPSAPAAPRAARLRRSRRPRKTAKRKMQVGTNRATEGG